MRIHHLNCGTFCPLGGPIMDGFSKGPLGRLVCHCLLIETEQGLVLVDTGLGMRDVDHPHPRLSRTYRALLNVRLRAEDTAVVQVRALGFRPEDVRHIVLTHLDFDHAGGLEDFPNAAVHVLDAELDAATHRRDGFVARRRYRPRQWDEVADWRTYSAGGEPWFGFEAVRDLQGLPPEILIVPLPGHTWGHAGVAVQGPDGWLLNAGDAYFHRHEMDAERPRCPAGLRAYQTLMEVDREARLANQRRLRELAAQEAGRLTVFCAHDALELQAFTGRTA